MPLEEFLVIFDRDYILEHAEFRKINAKYVGYSETMPELDSVHASLIRSVVASCLYCEYSDPFLNAAYLLFMIGSRQIMPNGNKRTAFFTTLFCLYHSKYRLRFKGLKYVETLDKGIREYQKANHNSRDKIKQKYITKLYKLISSSCVKI